MYFTAKSCTLFIMVVVVPASWTPGAAKDTVETHAFWSDDKIQDAYFVNVAQGLLLKNLKDRYEQARRPGLVWYFWSADNCSNQFKCGTGFALHSLFAMENKVTVVQHLGCPGHGKGTWDGEGGIVKAGASRELIKASGQILKSASDLVEYCSSELAHPKGRRNEITRRFFYEITEEMLQKRRAKKVIPTPIQGSLKKFCFWYSLEAQVIKSRPRSCFCSSCRAAGGASNGECKYHEYAKYAGKWKTHVVVSSDEKKAKKQTLDAYGLSLAQSVRPRPGSLTVVALRHDYPEFIAEYKHFLLRVLENPTLSGGLTSNVESGDYGQGPWPKCSLMLKGQYFEVYRGKTKKEMLTTQGLVMELNEDKIAYVHAEAVIMLRVCLSALTAPNYKRKLFSLSVEEHDRILQCINGNVSDYTDDDLSDDGML